jgi:ADP-heptose:LPS heptosyltransferase
MKIIKRILKFFLFELINVGVLISRRIKKLSDKSILIIRFDAIGDYILFRNFIGVLKENEKYKDYKITLVGNIKWKELAEYLDSDYVEKFIWIDTIKFNKNLFYRYLKLKEITLSAYDIVINPVWSRTYDMDCIVKVVNAKEKIGFKGDTSNIHPLIKKISDKYYTRFIDGENSIIFEFYRNKEFFEKLLGYEIKIKKPYIENKKITFQRFKELKGLNYCVLFIGASADFRKWGVENFAKVAKYIKQNYNYEIVLCGGVEDIEKTIDFEKIYGRDYINLVGTTSLVDMIEILSSANLVITNETFAHHLAVALSVKNIVVISNGNHFGRFIPYPNEIWDSYYPVYHPDIEKDLSEYEKLSNKYGYGSNLNINEITVDMVLKEIDKIMDKGVF